MDIQSIRDISEDLENVPMLALSATANQQTQVTPQIILIFNKIIQHLVAQMLRMRDPRVIQGPIDRPNIKVTHVKVDKTF